MNKEVHLNRKLSNAEAHMLIIRLFQETQEAKSKRAQVQLASLYCMADSFQVNKFYRSFQLLNYSLLH